MEILNAEEPRCRTGLKEPSLTAAAVPAVIAVAMASPPSLGSQKVSKRTRGEAKKAGTRVKSALLKEKNSVVHTSRTYHSK